MILSLNLASEQRAHLVPMFIDEMNDSRNINLFDNRWVTDMLFPPGVDVKKSESAIVVAKLSFFDEGKGIWTPHSKLTCMVFGQVSRDQFVLNFSRGRIVAGLADTRKDVCAEGRARYLTDFNLAFKIIKEAAEAAGF